MDTTEPTKFNGYDFDLTDFKRDIREANIDISCFNEIKPESKKIDKDNEN